MSQPLSDHEAKIILDAIRDGYPYRIEHGIIVVENPNYEPDDGSNLNLTLEIAHGRARAPAAAASDANQARLGNYHIDDYGVDMIATAMKEKLWNKRFTRGGWDDPEQCTFEYLWGLLRTHTAKGDPVDIANIAMMIYCREQWVRGVRKPTVTAASEELKGGYIENTTDLSALATLPIPTLTVEEAVEVAAQSIADDMTAQACGIKLPIQFANHLIALSAIQALRNAGIQFRE